MSAPRHPGEHPDPDAFPAADPAAGLDGGWHWHPGSGWLWHTASTPALRQPEPRRSLARPALEGADRRTARVELGVVAFAVALPGLVLGLALVGTPAPAPDLPQTWVRLAAAFLAALGPAAIVTYLLWRAGEVRAGGLGPIAPWPFVWQTALALLTFFVAQIVVGLVVALFTAILGSDLPEVSDAAAPALTPLYVVTGILLSIAAGFGEELVFRAYAITRMEDAGWPRLAIWVPNAAWALLHLYQGWRGPVVLFVMAVPWVLLFRWKRSVWPLVAAHAVYDVLVFLVFRPG